MYTLIFPSLVVYLTELDNKLSIIFSILSGSHAIISSSITVSKISSIPLPLIYCATDKVISSTTLTIFKLCLFSS